MRAPFVLVGARATELAKKNGMIRTLWLLTERRLYTRANSGNFHLPGEQRQGGSPIRTLFGGDARNRVVRRNVKPSRLAIDEEKILFRRLVLPAHLTGAAKIRDAGLSPHQSSVLRVALKKGCLQRPRTAILSLEPLSINQGTAERRRQKKAGHHSANARSHLSILQGNLPTRKVL